jgi:hypothetical protein
MILVVAREQAGDVMERCQALGERAYRIGEIEVKESDAPPLLLGPLAAPRR